jgi:hypothetical protein
MEGRIVEGITRGGSPEPEALKIIIGLCISPTPGACVAPIIF